MAAALVQARRRPGGTCRFFAAARAPAEECTVQEVVRNLDGDPRLSDVRHVSTVLGDRSSPLITVRDAHGCTGAGPPQAEVVGPSPTRRRRVHIVGASALAQEVSEADEVVQVPASQCLPPPQAQQAAGERLRALAPQ
ncbi:unnamed protein product, partial [Prorocentrum cordatum]